MRIKNPLLACTRTVIKCSGPKCAYHSATICVKMSALAHHEATCDIPLWTVWSQFGHGDTQHAIKFSIIQLCKTVIFSNSCCTQKIFTEAADIAGGI